MWGETKGSEEQVGVPYLWAVSEFLQMGGQATPRRGCWVLDAHPHPDFLGMMGLTLLGSACGRGKTRCPGLGPGQRATTQLRVLPSWPSWRDLELWIFGHVTQPPRTTPGVGGSYVPITARVRYTAFRVSLLGTWGNHWLWMECGTSDVEHGAALGLPWAWQQGERQAWTASRGVNICGGVSYCSQQKEGVARSCSHPLWLLSSVCLMAQWLGLLAPWYWLRASGLGRFLRAARLFQQRHSQRERAPALIIYSEQEAAVAGKLVAAGWEEMVKDSKDRVSQVAIMSHRVQGPGVFEADSDF